MSAYKEIFLSLSHSAQTISPTPTSDNYSLKTQTLSLPNHMVAFIIKGSVLTIEIFCTTSSTDSAKTTSFSLPDFQSPIIDSLTAIPLTPTSFLLIIFTEGSVLRWYEIDVLAPNVAFNYKPFFCNIDLDAKPTCVELIEKKQTYKFILGTENGGIYVIELLGQKNTNSNELSYTKFNVSNSNSFFTSMISSLSLNSSGSTLQKGISALKFLGNDIVCVLRNNLNFDVINIKKKQIIKTEHIDKCKNKQLDKAKIGFRVFELAKHDADVCQEKIFSVFIAMNFFKQKSEVYSLELWFCNIPKPTTTIAADSYEDYYSKIDIGSDLRIKNIREYCYEGKIIDISVYKSRLWILIKERKTGMKIQSLVLDSASEDELSPSSFDIFTTNNGISLLTIEEKYQNIRYIIAQIRMNASLSPSAINKLLYSLISNNEEYFQTETLINFINAEFKQQFINKRQVLSFIADEYLSPSSEKYLDNDIIVPLMIYFEDNNSMIGIGSFTNNDIESIIIFRGQGITILKKVDFLEKIDILAGLHEINMRKILFDPYSYINRISDFSTEKIINSYIAKEIFTGPRNSILLAMGLLRIYLTESYLMLNDEQDIKHKILNMNPTSSKIPDDFIDDVFTKNLSSQYNYLNFLDFIHEILYQLLSTYKFEIFDSINLFQQSFRNISNSQGDPLDSPLYTSDNQSIVYKNRNRLLIINSKYCDIISKLILNKITSTFNVLRDTLSLLQWRNTYSDVIGEDINGNEIEVEENLYQTSKEMFVQILSCWMVANHLTYFNAENVSNIDKSSIESNLKYKDKEVSCLEYFIFEKLSEKGAIILKLLKNDFINFIIRNLIWDVNYFKASKFEIYRFINNINKKEDHELIYVVNALQHLNSDLQQINFVFISIICMGWMENIPKMKKLMDQFFSLINTNSMMAFESFYHLMKFESISIGNNQNFIESPIIKGFLYLEKKMSKILKSKYMNEFYIFSYEYIFPAFKEIETLLKYKNVFIAYLKSLFDSSLNINCDLALNLLAGLQSLKKDNVLLLSIPEVKAGIISVFIKYFTNFNRKNPLIAKLIVYQYEFLIDICEQIEKSTLKNLKNSEIITPITSNSDINSVNENFDYFKLLIFIYLQMKEYSRSAVVSVQYAKAIDNAILADQLTPQEMVQLYRREVSVLNDALMSIKRCRGSICYVNYYEVLSEKKICEMKLTILLVYLQNDHLNAAVKEEEICLVKQNAQMLNFIFKIRLYDIAVENELVKYIKFKEGKIFIFNMIKNLIKDNLNELLEIFIKQIIHGNICNEYEFSVLDVLLSLNSEYKVGDIINELTQKNGIRVIEILLKYKKFDYLIDIIDILREKEEIPHYLIENLNKAITQNEANFIQRGFNSNTASKNKLKQIIQQINSNIASKT